MRGVCVFRGFHVFVQDSFVVAQSCKELDMSECFLVGFFRVFRRGPVAWESGL